MPRLDVTGDRAAVDVDGQLVEREEREDDAARHPLDDALLLVLGEDAEREQMLARRRLLGRHLDERPRRVAQPKRAPQRARHQPSRLEVLLRLAPFGKLLVPAVDHTREQLGARRPTDRSKPAAATAPPRRRQLVGHLAAQPHVRLAEVHSPHLHREGEEVAARKPPLPPPASPLLLQPPRQFHTCRLGSTTKLSVFSSGWNGQRPIRYLPTRRSDCEETMKAARPRLCSDARRCPLWRSNMESLLPSKSCQDSISLLK